jgi:hypothetical protein
MEEGLHYLYHWIKEREQIRIKKEMGLPPPWTGDPILQSYRFCNVHREHDKVTRWIRTHWSPWVAHSNYTLGMALARYINWPDTLLEIGYPVVWEPDCVLSSIRKVQARGGKVWTSAYIVSTNGNKMEKADYVVNVVLHMLYKRPVIINPKAACRDVYCQLRTYTGVGDFMAGQIIADLKNTRDHPLNDAPDFNDWCVQGPGSSRGMNRILGRNPKTSIGAKEFQDNVNIWRAGVERETGVQVDAQDMQNCLCETDKYIRVLKNEGRPRQTYQGT